jgi:monoamine oxidase
MAPMSWRGLWLCSFLVLSCSRSPGRVAEAGPAAQPPAMPAFAADVPSGVRPSVVVVGGGLAGLVSAYELEKRGVSVLLLEASDILGGRVATAYYGPGLYGEYGMQEIWADNPLLRIARKLAVPLDGAPEAAYSSVILDGKLVPFVPDVERYFASFLSPGERQRLRAWFAAARALGERAQKEGAAAAPLAELQSVSFAHWVGSFQLPKRVSEWIRLTIECELGTDWDSFSGLVGLLELDAFLPPGQVGYHVRDGNAQLIAALARARKGPTILSATVTTVERWRAPDGQPRARVSYLRNQVERTVETDRVVMAVPFVRLHQIRFEPPLAADKWQAIMTLNRGQYVVVHLLLDKAARQTWLVHGKAPFPVLTDGPLGVVYGVVHASPPEQPLEVFSLLVHGRAAAAFHMIPRETKVREILERLDQLWPGLSQHVRASYVYTYHPAAIPVWPPGRSPLDPLAARLRQPELGLQLVGDYTEGAHANGAAESAITAAARLAAELKGAR